MKRLLLVCFSLLSLSAFGQTARPEPAPRFTCRLPLKKQAVSEREVNATRALGQILIQLEPGASPDKVLADLSRAAGVPVTLDHTVATTWRIHLLNFDENTLDADALMRTAKGLPGIAFAQWNHIARERYTEPNDPYWNQQDNMRLIHAPDAWDTSTGGLTPTGDTIVLAILENFVQRNHPDLAPNIWHNMHEDSTNHVDDDGNGFIDDYNGWDFVNEGNGDGTSNGNSHGTAVSGVAGARGNNGTAVAGVNWNVKLMTLVNAAKFDDAIIAAYYYAATMRRLYNETHGAKGAFVVATNSSFGVDNGLAEDFPLWCAAYDSLGVVGVISIGATANVPVDVDVVGDIPSRCGSDYLIVVTGTDRFGKKSSYGYGHTSVDIGAPGESITSTGEISAGNPEGLSTQNGTSLASPHVTGAIGLAYSLNCDQFTADALTHPELCARRVRKLILDSVQVQSTLQGKISTGGYLDLARITEGVRNLCGGVSGPLAITNMKLQDFGRGTLEVTYRTPQFSEYRLRIVNALGQLMVERVLRPEAFGVNSEEFDVHGWSNGVYFVSIWRGDAIVTKKFLKI